MPVINFKAKEGKGWQPLPKGTYVIQINSVDPTKVSTKGNPQMMVEGQVVGGDSEGKKVTLWYPLDGAAAWRLRNLLEGTGVDFEDTELDEVDDEQKPIHGYSFDSDDLPGMSFLCDVDQREYQGKVNNDFANERPVDGAPAEAAAASKPAATATKPAAAAAAAPARTPTAAAAATSGVRRPRV